MTASTYSLLIPHTLQPRLLLLRHPTTDDYVLPHFTSDQSHFWQSVAHVNAGVLHHLGIEVTTLRCMKIAHSAADDTLRKHYALENHSPNWESPEGARWVTRAEVDGLSLAEPAERTIIEEWFGYYADLDTIQTHWYTPGWFAEASYWIESQLAEQGIALTGPVEQLRSWERSAILRAPTAQGLVYFKALPPMFRHEQPLVKWLAHHFPNQFPTPLVIDGWRRWLLMPDYGSHTLDSVPKVERWEAALREYAQLQVTLSVRSSELTGLGCPDRRLHALERQLENLLAASAADLSGDSLKLSEDEVAALRARIPEFKQWCKALAAYSIPASLEHGDLWAGQIVVNSDRFIFIDWSDSSISHPFFSLLFLTDDDMPHSREQLRDAYLRGWTAYEPLPKLVEAYEIAMQLAPLHYALIYQQHILPHMQVKWEMQNMIAFYLRRLLK